MSVPEAVRTLTAEPRFRRLVRAFAGDRADAILCSADGAQTEWDFQATVGRAFLDALIERTATRLTYRVDEQIGERPACLFISNHRDIVLDTALLNGALIARGSAIPHVAIGDNLLQTDWMVAFYRLCRAFVIRRELSGKQLYEQSRQVSEFVRNAIKRGESVWMAQRPGRTKDGADKTEPGLLRMLLLAYERTEPDLKDILHVTPVAVSYEFEPCDVFKAAALIGATTKNAAKVRARHDAANIMRGLVQQKGRIHVEARAPILVNNAEARARGNNRADFILELAQKVDREICAGYAIWSTNYLAYDLLEGRTAHADRYSPEEKDRFLAYVAHRSSEILANPDEARTALLSLYARPVMTRLTRQTTVAPVAC
ncbi:MAG TPA: 1-acyl-sn-glycerol-3-phosphate acyltransferase [Polyangiaceae bacterium]|nr:1-acyl-sn-glycerol-3-phosphate acyltransferase [Polyangiaceae bacterium]